MLQFPCSLIIHYFYKREIETTRPVNRKRKRKKSSTNGIACLASIISQILELLIIFFGQAVPISYSPCRAWTYSTNLFSIIILHSWFTIWFTGLWSPIILILHLWTGSCIFIIKRWARRKENINVAPRDQIMKWRSRTLSSSPFSPAIVSLILGLQHYFFRIFIMNQSTYRKTTDILQDARDFYDNQGLERL